MPLKKSASDAALKANFRTLKAEGYTGKQRVAIALNTQREAKKKAAARKKKKGG